MSASLAPDFVSVLAISCFGGLLGLIWCVQFLRVLLSREARGLLTWKAMAAWGACPATGLIVGALFLAQWPFALRVKLSEPALMRLVEAAGKGRTQVALPVRAGLVFVHHVVTREDCVMLYTEHGFIFTEYGLAYSRHGSRPESTYWGQSFRHLSGPWYVFEERD